MTLGEKLSELRNDVGLTQKQVSQLLGVATSTLGSWETDANEPPLAKLIDLAETYHVNIDYILGRTSEPISWNDFLNSNHTGKSEITIRALSKEFFSLNVKEQKEVINFMHFQKYKRTFLVKKKAD